MRLEPARHRAPGARARARQRRDLGHQRQDDDRGDGGGHPRARRRAPRAQPRRGQHGRRRGRRAHDRPARRRHRPLRGRRVLARPGRRRARSRARCCWPTCSATSSTATASSTRSPTAGRPWSASTSAALVLNADDPTVADLGRDVGATVLRGAGRRDGAAGDAARRGRHALPALRRALPLRRHLPRPPRPLPLRQLRRDAPRAAGLGPRHRARGRARRALHAAHAGRASARIALPLPGLYNVYNALGAAALALALGATLDHVDAGLHAVSPAFGRAETLRIADRDMSILLVKNPAGANEVLRTLTLEDGEHDVFAVLNDNIADGRDVSWVWDADFEVLAPRVRRATCSGTRAAEMALRLKYAGVPTDRIAVEPELGAGLDRALGDGDGPLFALPTYTAMLALRDLLVARGACAARSHPRPQLRRARGRARGDPLGLTDVLWHDIECGGYDLDLPLWRELADREGSPVLDVGAGHRARRARPRPPRPRGRRARPRPRAARRAAPTRAARPARTTGRGRRARVRPRPPLPARHRADADAAAARRRRGPRALPRLRARAPGARRAARRRAGRRARLLRRGARPSRRCPTCARSDGIVYASRPVAVRDLGDRAAIERVREIVGARRRRAPSAGDVIELDRVDADELEPRRPRPSACAPRRRARIPQTVEYVGSTVVMLRA